MTDRLLGDSVNRIFLTGGSGFIGSHILDCLLSQGYEVTVYDNLSNGRLEFIERHLSNPRMLFVRADCLDYLQLLEAMKGHDLVWHMAANTDIIGSHTQPDRDLKDCVVATFHVLEAMRQNGIQPILFASSGAVYGQLCLETHVSEDAGPLMPMSTYAAGKIGSEAFISCYCHLYGLRGWMFRFGNVLGSRLTHGVIFDFVRKLRKSPHELMILGDGTQEKNYFLTEDCIGGMGWAYRNVHMFGDTPCDVFNLGTTTVTRVTDIARIVIEEMGLPDVHVSIQGTKLAWLGDQPKVHFTVDKISRLGWRCERSSDNAVRIAVRRVLGKEVG
jgi:UDP-glucose 4-epimerase